MAATKTGYGVIGALLALGAVAAWWQQQTTALLRVQADAVRAESRDFERVRAEHRRLTAAQVPGWSRSPRAWRRSWLLGFVTAVVSRVRAAEHNAASQATSAAASGDRTALVLADRRQVIRRNIEAQHGVTFPSENEGGDSQSSVA